MPRFNINIEVICHIEQKALSFVLHSPLGRLSKEDIEKMVQEAEQFRVEDEAQRDKVTAKNSLESLAFNMKSTVEDEKLQDKISPEDKKTIIDKCNEVIAWLDRNQVKIQQEVFFCHIFISVWPSCVKFRQKTAFRYLHWEQFHRFPLKMTRFFLLCPRWLRRTSMITSRRS